MITFGVEQGQTTFISMDGINQQKGDITGTKAEKLLKELLNELDLMEFEQNSKQ